MTQSNDRSAPTPGQRLSEARLAKNWTLKQAARQLKLPSSILSDLEADNYSNLAPVYVRGYLLNYARLLDIDDESFRATLPGHGEEAPALRQAVPVKREMLWLERALRGATYVAVTAGIIVPLVWWFTQGAVQLSVDSGSRIAASRDAGAEPAAAESAAPAGDDPLRVSSGREAQSAPHVSASVTPLPRFDGPPGDGADAAVPRSPLAQPAPESLLWSSAILGDAGTASTTAGTTPDRIQLWLNSDSWVEITDGADRRLEYGLLEAGEARSYRGQPPVRVLIGRSSAVDLHYNGREVDLSRYTRGNVASLSLGETQPEAD